MQTTDHVLMIRPARFMSNPQTALSNAFQHPEPDTGSAQRAALSEFDAYAGALRKAGVGVLVVEDSAEPHTPDSIFPNNWVSFHADGRVVLYPMEAPNRRLERRSAVLATVERHFEIRERLDLSRLENEACFLEGTGSMVLDHAHKLAYVCHSSRSHPRALAGFAAQMDYRAVCFNALDRNGKAIYHTNVMMCVGSALAIVCMEAIRDRGERDMLARTLTASGKELIGISLAQMAEFAGNTLELRSQRGHPVFALSRRAWAALNTAQRRCIKKYAEPVLAPIDTIERLGGGGARCMLAEIFLPKRAAGGLVSASGCAQISP